MGGLQHKKLLEAVADPPDDEGMTAQELAAAAAISPKTMQVRLKDLTAKGLLIVGSRTIKDSMGRRARTPVYRFKEES